MPAAKFALTTGVVYVRDGGTFTGPLTVTTGPFTLSSGQFLGPDGTAAAPTYAFTSEASTGWFRIGAGNIGLGLSGNGRLSITSDGSVRVPSAGRYNFSSGTDPTVSGSDTAIVRIVADCFGPIASDAIGFTAKAFINTAPTIASGFGTSPSMVATNGTAAFSINVGTGGTATAGIITLPTAANGWIVHCVNISNAAIAETVQTATTTTSATISNFARVGGLLTAWTASDIIRCTAVAF